MIRQAKFEDIPRCIQILVAAQRHSIYADVATVDAARANQMLCTMAMRRESKDAERTFFMVSMQSGVVEGFLVAFMQPIYQISMQVQSTDLYTLLTARAPAQDFLKLLMEYKKWTAAQAVAVEAFVAVTDAMGPDWRRLVPVYEKLGFEQAGVVLRWRVER